MKSLLREPLVHFLLIGSALFIIFGLCNDQAGPETERIVITPGQIDFLEANFTRTWQRPPTEKELQGLTDSFVRDEIFYREALALGLDRDDNIIRRRLKQKLEFMSDDLAEVVTPSDEELRQFLHRHPERFCKEPQVAFRHIYFDIKEHGKGAFEEADRLLAELVGEKNNMDLDTLGDPLMLPMSFDLTTSSQISRLFGESFVLKLLSIEPGKWAGPIRSGYGLHLIKVTNKIDGRFPELEEIRDLVEREWFVAHKKKLQENIYNKLRQKYTVVFKQPAKEQNIFQAVSEAQAGQREQ